MKPALIPLIFVLIAMLDCRTVTAQQAEYRITATGKYQYLSSRHEAGMVFDESLGAYYKDITDRTFFLETQRRGYIPRYYTFEGFLKLTLPEKQRLLKQPHNERDCSSGNVNAECVNYNIPSTPVVHHEKTTIIDLSPKCVGNSNSPQNKMNLTDKLIVHPNSTAIQNDDCKEPFVPVRPDANQSRAVKMALIKE